MFTCASCNSQHTEGIICSVCKNHYDFPCSGITEGGYRKLGDRKNTWRCTKCKPSSLPAPATKSPLPSQWEQIQEDLTKIAHDLAPLATLVEDVKQIKNEITSLRESLDMAHELMGSFSTKMNSLENRILETEKAVCDVQGLRTEVERLKLDLQIKDQWARANNVEIRGIPQRNTENLYQIVQKIGTITGFPFKKEETNYIARIPTRSPNKVKSIIVAFNCRYTKEEFVAAARKKKQLPLSGLGFQSENNFYINDHLTQANKILLNKARTLAKERNFQYIWVKHCKIMARRTDTSPIFFIKNEKDLQKIIS